MTLPPPSLPVLLYNDECAVCRMIARWVERSGKRAARGPQVLERPIGDDPAALRLLNPALDIWDAYGTIHLIMPDGSMKLGGEAVAEVLRGLPPTRWATGALRWRVLGVRPFQQLLNLAYAALAGVRPLLGCESCGTPRPWMRPLRWLQVKWKRARGGPARPARRPHFSHRPALPASPGVGP